MISDLPPFDSIIVSKQRMKEICEVVPRVKFVGNYNGVDVYTDPYMPNDVFALRNHGEIVAIVRVGK